MSAINVWPGFGITDEELEEKAEWLSRQHPRFKDPMGMFFYMAANLLRFTRQDFTLLPLVFVQTVIGLEKVLRHIYQRDQDGLTLKAMLQMAVNDGHFIGLEKIDWASFPPSITWKWQIIRARDDVGDVTVLIPNMRNELVHGDYTLTVEFLVLSLHVRRMADALIPHLPPTWSEQNEAAFAARAEEEQHSVLS